MSAGMTLFFTGGYAGTPSTLISASVYDADGVTTSFTAGVDADMREGWEQNVLGKWDHATDKTPKNVGELIAYNMLLPVAYEEFDTKDAAQARADELVSADPVLTAEAYGQQRQSRDADTAGGTQ